MRDLTGNPYVGEVSIGAGWDSLHESIDMALLRNMHVPRSFGLVRCIGRTSRTRQRWSGGSNKFRASMTHCPSMASGWI